jgi:hypothetical protein
MFTKKLLIAALVTSGVAISSAPAHASSHTQPHADGIIAVLIGLHHRDGATKSYVVEKDLMQPDM